MRLPAGLSARGPRQQMPPVGLSQTGTPSQRLLYQERLQQRLQRCLRHPLQPGLQVRLFSLADSRMQLIIEWRVFAGL